MSRGHIFYFACAWCSGLLAQNYAGSITGTVRDAKGIGIAGTQVAVVDTVNGLRRIAIADSAGAYQLLGLAVGTYRVTAGHDAFADSTSGDQRVDFGQTITVDFVLQLKTVQQSIDVGATASEVETVQPVLGSTVSVDSVHNLPLNGRDTLQLALIEAGASPAPASPYAATGVRTGEFALTGGRDSAVTYLLDGGDNTSFVYGLPTTTPNPDTVEEFQVMLNNYSVEFGRTNGGVINIITKSGTNRWHGTAFDYLRNEALDANYYFNNEAGQPRALLRRNQFGGTLGGPIVRDRAFFFFGYQGQRQTQAILNQGIGTFTPAELQGNFSGNAGVAAFLTANAYFQTNPSLAAQGIIDPSKIDPVAQKYIAAGLIPASNSGVITPVGIADDNREEYLGKIDFNITQTERVSGTFDVATNPTLYPFLTPGEAPDVPGFPGRDNLDGYFANIALTSTPRADLVNEFHLVAQRNRVKLNVPAASLPGPAQLGYTGIVPDQVPAPPQLNFLNSGLQLGNNLFGPVNYADTTVQGSELLMLTKAKHTIKAGGSSSAMGNNIQSGYLVNGAFYFAGTSTGSDLADFLLGLPTAFYQGERGANAIRSRRYLGFVEDQWKLRPTLTITLGLRYEYDTPKTDPGGRIEALIPGLQSVRYPNAPLGLVFSGDPGTPKGTTFPDRRDWSPRVGFAWDVFGDHKTSVRGGFGVFYDMLLGIDNEYETGSPPFARVGAVQCLAPCFAPASAGGPFGFMSDPYGSTGTPNPFATAFPSPKTLNFATEGFLPFGFSSGFVDPHERTPYTFQYNVSLQHELPAGILAEAAYVGSASRKLTAYVDGDPIIRGTTTYLLNAQPGPQIPDAFGPAPFVSINGANASYNSLLLQAQRRLGAGGILGSTLFTFAYTWSHEIDDADGLFRNNQQVPYYDHSEFRASGAADIRQRAVVTAQWPVPSAKHGQTWLGKLTDNWTIYGIYTVQTGMPIDVTAGLPVLGSGIPGPSGAGDQNLVRPDALGPAISLDPSVTRGYVVNGQTVSGNFFFNPLSVANPSCYASEAVPGSGAPGACPAFTYGTLPRDAFRGAGRSNLDFAAGKQIRFPGDRWSATLRVEFFNIFNHTQFSNPVGPVPVTSPLLGQATSTFDPRIGQLSLRFSF